MRGRDTAGESRKESMTVDNPPLPLHPLLFPLSSPSLPCPHTLIRTLDQYVLCRYETLPLFLVTQRASLSLTVYTRFQAFIVILLLFFPFTVPSQAYCVYFNLVFRLFDYLTPASIG